MIAQQNIEDGLLLKNTQRQSHVDFILDRNPLQRSFLAEWCA